MNLRGTLPYAVHIGRDCGFSTAISVPREIRIGDRVLVGANCTLSDTDHHALDVTDRARGVVPEAIPIHMGDDVFVEMNVLILKGVRIGDCTVVAANSVVTRPLPSRVLAVGALARPISIQINDRLPL